MVPENEARLRKIERISGILRWVCKGLLALIVIGFLMATVALLANRGGSVGYFDGVVPDRRPDPRPPAFGAGSECGDVGSLVHVHLSLA